MKMRGPSVEISFEDFKTIFKKHLDKIRKSPSGDKNTRYFRSTTGEADNLHNIPIRGGSGESGGGYFIANFHADNGGIYPIYCKVFNPSSIYSSAVEISGLVTEACISAKSVNQSPLIPTFVRNYGVLAGNHPESMDFYNPGKTKYVKHIYENMVVKTPVYIFNEYFNEVDDIGMLDTKGSAMPFCKFARLNKDERILGRLVYRTLLTIKEMHNRGIYHNDLHCNNIMVVKTQMKDEYDVRIFDWDFGFSAECMPPKEGQKDYCGDINDCYSRRDYWDIIRFITSLPITKEQFSKMMSGNEKLAGDIGFFLENKSLPQDDFFNGIAKVGASIGSAQEVIDSFNPSYVSPSDDLFAGGIRERDKEAIVVNRVSDQVIPDKDKKKTLTENIRRLVREQMDILKREKEEKEEQREREEEENKERMDIDKVVGIIRDSVLPKYITEKFVFSEGSRRLLNNIIDELPERFDELEFKDHPFEKLETSLKMGNTYKGLLKLKMSPEKAYIATIIFIILITCYEMDRIDDDEYEDFLDENDSEDLRFITNGYIKYAFENDKLSSIGAEQLLGSPLDSFL